MKRFPSPAPLLFGLGLALSTPLPVPGQQPDAGRLMEDLSVLAHDSMQGRAPGSLASEQARDFLVRSFSDIGVTPTGDGYEQRFSTLRGSGVNVVGAIAGRDRDAPVIVITAHYDHEGVRRDVVYNGADDNASGVVAGLAIARSVIANPLNSPLIIAFVDAEESGMVGSGAFVQDPPVPLDRIGLNVNLDMVARTDGLLWAVGAHHTPELRATLEGVATAARVQLRLGHDRPGAPEGADWTNSSDHAPFHRAGIPFVYFGVEDHEDYHKPTDDFERVKADEFLASVQTILSALRALDEVLPTLPKRAR